MASDALLSKLKTSSDAIKFSENDEFETVRPLFETLAEEFKHRSPNFDLALEGLLTAVLVRIARTVQDDKVFERSEDIAARFRDLLEDSFQREHAVSFYADALGLSPRALTMQLSRLLGQSPRDLIQGRCILEAKRLLKNSASPIGEIAERLGFEDANYFSRFFKSQTSMTPAEFRRER